MKQGHHQIPYRPMPANSRFGIKSWLLYDESCYTEDELELRAQLLKIRSASTIHPDILLTDNSWFNPDETQALVTINSETWFLPQLYKPRRSIVAADFHIPLIENTLLKWTALSTMMRNIGDYLHTRNQNLPKALLNQPLNYILLDLVQMLKHLASKDNGEFVARELKHIAAYLRASEIEISPMAGSDRLFLADCRRSMETQVLPEIHRQLQMQVFRTRIPQIRNHLLDIAEQRHTLLHFSLATVPVNEHPYLEYFIEAPRDLDKNSAFPTLAAKACGINQPEQEKALPGLRLSATVLRDCPNFEYFASLPENVMDAYGQALSDIQEILRFQEILNNLCQVIDKTGELFAITQFREEIIRLMEETEGFIRLGQEAINTIHEANSLLYHKSIYEKKRLPVFEKLLTSRERQLDAFIKNQDNLARFPVSPGELLKTEQALIHQIKQFISDLRDKGDASRQIPLLENSKAAARELIESMHYWVDDQCLRQGRSCAPMPRLALETGQIPEIPQSAPANRFFSPTASGHTAVPECQELPCNTSSLPASDKTEALDYSFLILIPLGLFLLKLLYDAWHEQFRPRGDVPAFNDWKDRMADNLALINAMDDEILFDRNYFNEAWSDLVDNGQYNVQAMQELCADLEHFLLERGKINKAFNLHIH